MSEDSHFYNSYKEDRDLILEYNQISVEDAGIVNILDIGIDNLTRQQAVFKVLKMIEDKGVHHVITLNPYKLAKIKSNSDLRLISDRADMHLASGAGIQWAARMLKTPIIERIGVLSFMMEVVRLAEIKEYSIFFVGGKPEIAERVFFNIKKSFPQIRIVGRHGGYFNQEREKSVIEAIRKSEANIIFVGLGFPKEDRWINSIKHEFKNAVFISVGGSMDTISGDIRKAPDYFMQNGLDWFYRIITKPWRYLRLLRLVLFVISVMFRKIFRRKR
ncbi:MAG TPA: WecB/TagA/CpsF family glycosyltransferase [Spirochaetota bacterium]|nr:WecB/TagA/CpsF family glycosyltransferase [Spirochaetota bacterium]HPJ33625.1 WecB/TagA/CpsF family glycosyltransferase [Spirochaetota bacterium]